MTKKVIIRIPFRHAPEPWKHIKAWLTRSWVESYDYCDNDAAKTAHERADEYYQMYLDERSKRQALADEHSPVFNRPNDPAHQFTCAANGCAYFWPCPTYRWATEQPDLEMLRLTRKKSGDKVRDGDTQGPS